MRTVIAAIVVALVIVAVHPTPTVSDQVLHMQYLAPLEDPREVVIVEAYEAGINIDDALRVTNCESGFNPIAQNPTSSAYGLHQWLDSTWENIGSPGDRGNPRDSARAFAQYYKSNPQWWECK